MNAAIFTSMSGGFKGGTGKKGPKWPGTVATVIAVVVIVVGTALIIGRVAGAC